MHAFSCVYLHALMHVRAHMRMKDLLVLAHASACSSVLFIEGAERQGRKKLPNAAKNRRRIYIVQCLRVTAMA